MMKKAEFDAIIRQNLKENLKQDVFGYVIEGTDIKPYMNYYNNAAFQLFIAEMKTPAYVDIFKVYNKGYVTYWEFHRKNRIVNQQHSYICFLNQKFRERKNKKK